MIHGAHRAHTHSFGTTMNINVNASKPPMERFIICLDIDVALHHARLYYIQNPTLSTWHKLVAFPKLMYINAKVCNSVIQAMIEESPVSVTYNLVDLPLAQSKQFEFKCRFILWGKVDQMCKTYKKYSQNLIQQQSIKSANK